MASLRDFERFLRACALRSGQLLNKADLARDVGISASTASQWLGVLVASNLVLLLEPWFQSRSKSITKSPKLYFTDTGLLLYLLNVLTVEDLLRAPLLGSVWESFVFSELRKKQVAATGQWSIHFFRDRALEVDFLISRGGVHELIEVKWAEDPAKRDTASLEAVARVLGPENVARKTLICRTPNPYPLESGVEVTGIVEYSLH